MSRKKMSTDSLQNKVNLGESNYKKSLLMILKGFLLFFLNTEYSECRISIVEEILKFQCRWH